MDIDYTFRLIKKNQDDELYPFAFATLEQKNAQATQLTKPIKISIKNKKFSSSNLDQISTEII